MILLPTVSINATSSWFPPSTVGLVQANLLVGLFYLLFVAIVALAFPVFSPIWPSAAVAMFAVLIGGWRWLPGIAIASWLGNDFIMSWSTGWSLWITLGNILGPLLSMLILRRFIPDTSLALESGRSVVVFTLVAALSAAISASFGGLATVEDIRPDLSCNEAFLSWLIGDLTSVLMLTPAFVLWWKDPRLPCQLLRDDPEMWLAASSLIIMTAVLFFMPATSASSLLRTGIFLILLPLVWVAMRFPQRSAFTLMSSVFVLSVVGIWLERGVIVEMQYPYTRLQIILISMSVITLLVSAMSIERRRVLDALNISFNTLEERVNERTAQLRDNLKYLEMLLDNVPMPMVITRPDQSIVIYANLAAADYSGFSIARMIGSSSMSYFHTLEDFQALEHKLQTEGSLSSHEVALRHRNGHTLWALVSAVPSRYNDIPAMMFAFQDISHTKQRELDLEQMVSTDTLTLVATRRHFMQRGCEILSIARRSGQKIALFILDLDHFKAINDTYGHPTGDLVLRRVAEAFRSALRTGDLCGRLGGEEFGILLTNTDVQAAERSAERLRQVINELHIQLDNGASINPSVSIGAVLLLPSAMSQLVNPNLDEAINIADQALYHAKNTGRNRVVFAPPLVFHTEQETTPLQPNKTNETPYVTHRPSRTARSGTAPSCARL